MEKENEVAGRLAEVVEHRRPYVAYVLGAKGKRLRVITPTGKETTVSSGQILLISRGVYRGLSRNEILTLLSERDRRREGLKAEVDPAELWELVVDEAESFDPYELAEIYFGASAKDDEAAALIRIVLEDRLYFRLRGNQILVHTRQQVEKLKLAKQREEERLRRLSQGEIFISKLMQGEKIEDVPEEIREYFLSALKELCLLDRETSRIKEVKEVLSRLRATGPETPFRLLVKAGVFREDENLEILRFKIPTEFPEEVLREAEQLRERPLEREDFTLLETFTVDAADTRDFDDALHFEDLGDRYLVGVHITDVSSVVPPDSEIFREALRRIVTLYLPERIIPMLPPVLSEERLSLKVGEVRPAVSFLITFSPEGEILESRISLSRIKVARRLTYEKVDRLLAEGDPFFTALFRLAQNFQKRRWQKGALSVNLPEVVLRVDSSGEIKLERLEFTPARMMVAEFMIAANFVAAEFLKNHDIPAIYRFQKEPLEKILEPGEEDLVKAFLQLRYMVRGEQGLEPEFHHGLGLPVYTTVTSPIRRFTDLINQHQLVAYLAEQRPPFSREELEKVLPEIEERQTATNQVRARTHRYWLLKYLKHHCQGRRIGALVLEAGERRARVLLPDFMLPAELQLPPGRTVRTGEEIKVLVQRVNPRLEVLKLALA